MGYSSITYFVDEVGESLGWILDLNTSRSLCWLAMDGICVCMGGVAIRGCGGVSDVVGIKLFPLPTNIPLESLSLCISCFVFFLTSIFTSPATAPKCLANLMSLNCQPRCVD